MSKFKKIIIAVLVGIGLMLGSEQRASAQGMPVIDFSSIMTTVLQFLQDAIIESDGAFSKLATAAEHYQEIQDKIAKVQEIIAVFQLISEVGDTIREIVDISSDMARRIERLNQMAYYISQQSYGRGLSAIQIAVEFGNVTFDCIEAITPIMRKLFSINSMKRSDITDIIMTIKTSIRDFAQQIYTTVASYEYSMYKAYQTCRQIQTAVKNAEDADLYII